MRIPFTDKKVSQLTTLKVLLLVGAVAIIAYFTPSKDRTPYNYKEGVAWQYASLIAPFDMSLNLDAAREKAIRDSLSAEFVPVYKMDSEAVSHQLQELHADLKAAHAPASVQRVIIEEADRIFTAGIVDNETYEKINSGNLDYMRFIDGHEVQTRSTRQMYSERQAYQHLDTVATAANAHNYMLKANVNNYINPNISYDQVTSKKLFDQLIEQNLAAQIVVLKDDPIVKRGEMISAKTYALIREYERRMAEIEASRSGITLQSVGHWAVITLLLCSLYGFLKFFRFRIFNDARKLTFMMSAIVTFTVMVILVMSQYSYGIYVAPFAIVPIIFTAFFDSRTALFAHLVQVFICATIVVDNSLDFIIMQFIVGLVTILTVQELSKRSQLVGCAIWVFIGYSVTYVALMAIHGIAPYAIDHTKFLCFLANVVLLSFSYFLIFMVERIFGFTSTVTLVELTDINNPLLRKLSESCPGTFQHSMQVASIAAEAAHKIGANVQLVRAGALYHDIGKIKNPNFFTENQRGVNPHDVLTPQQSAEIVIRHVTDGMRLADKGKLPQVVKDFILQHHGQGLTKYFYTQARNAAGGADIDPEPFTYPGPNPQTKETAILMMADATEAASKSLKDHSIEALSSLVEKIINGQIADGLMRDAPISFRDVELIKRTFIERLATFYHMRIAYPEAIKKKDSE